MRHRGTVPSRPTDARRPLSTSEALARGITRGQLRGPRYRQVIRGFYVTGESARDRFATIRAAVDAHPPGAYASHLSAARLYDLPVPTTSDEHVTVVHAADKRRRTAIRTHSTSSPARLTRRHGILLSAPCDTFVALASMLDMVELVVVGDAMVKSKLAAVEELVAAAAAASGKGCLRARKAAAYVREGVDSPQETRLRMLIVLAGLPEPKVNHIVRDQAGEWVMRFDLSYLKFRVIVEYDGRQHADDAPQWEGDLERREMLDQAGWKLVTVTAKGIYKQPERTLARVVAALHAQGCRTASLRSNAWRPYFPGK